MPNIPTIQTHSTETFREHHIRSEPHVDELLKPDFGKFFVIRVEEMIRLIKLPLPPTRSTTHTLFFLTEGEGVMAIGGRTYTTHRGECLVVPAGQVFSFSNEDQNRGYLCNFHNDFLVGKMGSAELLRDFEFLTGWGNPQVRLDATTAGWVEHLFRRILDEYTAHGLLNADLVRANFLTLLCEINAVYEPLQHSDAPAAAGLTSRFKTLLFKHIREKHRVADYAALLNISPNHLNKAVKQVTGQSPTKWIDEALVLEAKMLLHQTDAPIGEVAEMLGVADASYFGRLFKKYAGVTPVQFRRQVR